MTGLLLKYWMYCRLQVQWRDFSSDHGVDVCFSLPPPGADISRTVMSHLDRTFFDEGKLLQLAKRGCYLEYDLFGVECSHYQVWWGNFGTSIAWYLFPFS